MWCLSQTPLQTFQVKTHLTMTTQGCRKWYGQYGFGCTNFSLGLPRLVTKMRFRLQLVNGQAPLAAAYVYGLFQPSFSSVIFVHPREQHPDSHTTYIHACILVVFYEWTEWWSNTSHYQVIFLHAACNSKKRLALSMCTVTWIKHHGYSCNYAQCCIIY